MFRWRTRIWFLFLNWRVPLWCYLLFFLGLGRLILWLEKLLHNMLMERLLLRLTARWNLISTKQLLLMRSLWALILVRLKLPCITSCRLFFFICSVLCGAKLWILDLRIILSTWVYSPANRSVCNFIRILYTSESDWCLKSLGMLHQRVLCTCTTVF